MKHITANVAQQDFNGLLNSVIELGESVSIATDKGAAILTNQDELSGLQETIYLQSIPDMIQSINTAREAPANERLDSVGWDIN